MIMAFNQILLLTYLFTYLKKTLISTLIPIIHVIRRTSTNLFCIWLETRL